MQHLDFDCSVPTPTLLTMKNNKMMIPGKTNEQWKLLEHFTTEAGSQLILYEHIMGCPVCVTSFVPPVPSPAVIRQLGFSLCGLEPNQMVGNCTISHLSTGWTFPFCRWAYFSL